MCKLQTLYYGRIDISVRININKTNASTVCDIWHYWYFLDKRFKFESYICNGCHDVLIMPINLDDIAILNINGADYCCIVNVISKRDYINLLKNIDLIGKTGVL